MVLVKETINKGKLEIDEMVEMFNRNNIDVTMEELLKLFFKGKNLPKNEDPFLNVYQFIEFALSKDCDQDYRNFMREVKNKIARKKDQEIRRKQKQDTLNVEDVK
jgi:hypothetical protein